MNKIPLLNIVMPTYNHEKYIAEAIKSVLAQQCDFIFKLIICDDCSSDNTKKICEKYQANYPDIILFLQNETNLGLIKNYIKIFDACHAKYIAILESDDYWTDPLKLQRQVEIMESDETIGLVHTRSATLYENGELKVNYHLTQSKYNYEELYSLILQGKYGIVPLTVCFRRNLLAQIDFDFCVKKQLKTLDAFMWPEFAIQTKIYFLNQLTGHYRYLKSSESNSIDINKKKQFVESSQLILSYYFRKYLVVGISEVELMGGGNYTLTKAYLDIKDYVTAYYYASKLPFIKIKYLFVLLIAKYPILYPLYLFQKKSIDILSRVKQFVFYYLINTYSKYNPH